MRLETYISTGEDVTFHIRIILLTKNNTTPFCKSSINFPSTYIGKLHEETT